MAGKAETTEPTTDRNKSVQIDPEIHAKIQAHADEGERTVQKQTNRILRLALDQGITGN